MYNLFTGSGFDTGFMGEWSLAWLSLVILFFIIAIANKWITEFGYGFNALMAYAVSFIGFFIVISITGSTKWSFLTGIIGVIVGGFLVGYFWDTSDGGGDW